MVYSMPVEKTRMRTQTPFTDCGRITGNIRINFPACYSNLSSENNYSCFGKCSAELGAFPFAPLVCGVVENKGGRLDGGKTTNSADVIPLVVDLRSNRAQMQKSADQVTHVVLRNPRW